MWTLCVTHDTLQDYVMYDTWILIRDTLIVIRFVTKCGHVAWPMIHCGTVLFVTHWYGTLILIRDTLILTEFVTKIGHVARHCNTLQYHYSWRVLTNTLQHTLILIRDTMMLIRDTLMLIRFVKKCRHLAPTHLLFLRWMRWSFFSIFFFWLLIPVGWFISTRQKWSGGNFRLTQNGQAEIFCSSQVAGPKGHMGRAGPWIFLHDS